jgi:transcriptional regulator with XRE-family HTH domain
VIDHTIEKEASPDQPVDVIDGKQIRMARAGLEWTAAELAEKASIGVATVRRAEAGRDITVANLLAIQRAFEEAGIVFFDAGQPSPNGGAGLRFRQ